MIPQQVAARDEFEFINSLPYAYAGPAVTGKFKVEIDDFVVNEVLGFDPSGEGEHVFLRIEKKDETTDRVAKSLAKYVGVPRRDVGYAGLKDRFAKTTQWFSVRIPLTDNPDWLDFNSTSVHILEQYRHRKKLKIGALSANQFEINLRNLRGDLPRMVENLRLISRFGVPNYFGPQRFGYHSQNLAAAVGMFSSDRKTSSRFQRGILLSAARAYIFNQILARRVERGDWNRACKGDVLIFNGSGSCFRVDELDRDIYLRVGACEIHPTGAMWGQGISRVGFDIDELEEQVVGSNALLCNGLEGFGLEMSRRSLRSIPKEMDWWQVGSDSLRLKFSLVPGAFATSVLREFIDTGTDAF